MPGLAAVLSRAGGLLAHPLCRVVLSRVNEVALLKGAEWAIRQPRLEAKTRTLFEEGHRRRQDEKGGAMRPGRFRPGQGAPDSRGPAIAYAGVAR
jgi:hypothetical protein